MYFWDRLIPHINPSYLLRVGNSSRWVLLDTTISGTWNNLNSHVTRFTPGSSPRISKDPVFGTVFIAPTNKGDGMIILGSTAVVVQNTTLVSLESTSVGFNQNGDSTLGQSSFHLINVVRSDSLSTF